MTKRPPKRLGTRLRDAMTELHDALRSGRPLEEQFTVRTVEIAEPRTYSAKEIQRMRHRLSVSQAVFSRLIGVSVELVQHWEQGVTTPRPLARRLMDEIRRDPSGFLSRNITNGSKRAAGQATLLNSRSDSESNPAPDPSAD